MSGGRTYENTSYIKGKRQRSERKQMFGYTARHIITTMETESSPEACSPMKSKMQIDGCYIDAEFALECDSGVAYKPCTPPSSGGCQDRYVPKQVGTAKKGYPVCATSLVLF